MAIGTKIGRGVAKTLFQKDKAGQRLANAYTGFKPRGSLIAGAVGAGIAGKIAWEGGFGAQSINKNNPTDIFSTMDPGGVAMNRSQHVQAINPSILASGRVPGGAEGGSNAPTLNATGDMVLGMHNARHG